MTLAASVESDGLNPVAFADNQVSLLLDRLRFQRENGRFTDVLITVKNQKFAAHRSVLAGCSPYFDSILTHAKVIKEQVIVNCANPPAFEAFLKYIYSGKVVIDRSIVGELLALSTNFMISRLKRYCAEYLDRYLDASNVLTIKHLSSKYNAPHLLKSATEYFDANINRCILESVDILKFSISQLTRLLKEPKYTNVLLPDAHLKLIIRWISHDTQRREYHFETLLSTVSLLRVSEATIEFLLDYSTFLSRCSQSRLLLMQQLSRLNMLPPKYKEQFTVLQYTKANDFTQAPGPVRAPAPVSPPPAPSSVAHENAEYADEEEGSSESGEDDGSDSDVSAGGSRQRKTNRSASTGDEPPRKLRARQARATANEFGEVVKKRRGKNEKETERKKRGRPPKRLTDEDIETSAYDEDDIDGVYADATYLHNTITYNDMEDLDPDSVPDGEELINPTGAFPCRFCKFVGSFEQDTARHCARKHNRNTIFMCPLCEFECKWSRVFYEHVRKHHYRAPPFSCVQCPYISNERLEDMLHHLLTHTDARYFKCGICGFRGRTRTHLWAHEKIHNEENAINCIECGRTFNSQKNLDKHMLTHSIPRTLACEDCGFLSKTPEDLLAHKKGHMGDVFYCHIEGCDYSSAKKSQLAAHLRTHLAVRSHMCKICNRSFVEKSHLVRHERIHLDEKPFRCDLCDYASSRRDKLKEHILKHHNTNSAVRSQRRRYKREKQLAALAAQEEAEQNLGLAPENMFRPINAADSVQQWQSAHGSHFQQNVFAERSSSALQQPDNGQLSPGSLSLGAPSTSVLLNTSAGLPYPGQERNSHNQSETFGLTTPTNLTNRAMSVPPYQQFSAAPPAPGAPSTQQPHFPAPGAHFNPADFSSTEQWW